MSSLKDSLLEKASGALGEEAFAFGKEVLGDAYEKLSPEEKDAFKSFIAYFSSARIMELAGLDIGETIEILQEAALQWRAIGEDVLIDAVKEVGRNVLGLGGSFLGGALRAFIAGL